MERLYRQLTEARAAFRTAVERYHADQMIPDDVTRAAATLSYRLGEQQKYETYKRQILSRINTMYAAELMDACQELFECGMDSDDEELIAAISTIITEVFPEARRYRLGGDEFVILSFDAEEAFFQEQLKRLAGSWSSQHSTSVGSVWLERAENIAKSVALADERMYRDKSRYYSKSKHDRRMRTRTAAEESPQTLNAATALLPGGFFAVNQELLHIFGCQTREEFAALTGNSFRGMVYPEDLSRVERDISSQIAGKTDIDRVTYRIRRKDGTVKRVVDYSRFVHTEKYGNVYYVFLSDAAESADCLYSG